MVRTYYNVLSMSGRSRDRSGAGLRYSLFYYFRGTYSLNVFLALARYDYGSLCPLGAYDILFIFRNPRLSSHFFLFHV